MLENQLVIEKKSNREKMLENYKKKRKRMGYRFREQNKKLG